MRERQCIKPERLFRMVFGGRILKLRNHALAAAAITGDSVDREREIFRQKPGIHQRPHETNRAGRIATRITDPF